MQDREKIKSGADLCCPGCKLIRNGVVITPAGRDVDIKLGIMAPRLSFSK
jgi:hypothetical protein